MVPPIPSAIGAKCSRETGGDVPTVRNERRVGQRTAKVQSDGAVTWSAGKKPQPQAGHRRTGRNQDVKVWIERARSLASRAKECNRQGSRKQFLSEADTSLEIEHAGGFGQV